MRRYVDLIAPWAASEWLRYKYDPSPTYMVFPIPSRALPGVAEQLLLGDERSRALMHLISWVNRFNRTLELASRAKKNRPEWFKMLHTGLIGHEGSGALYDALMAAEKAI
jgi:hypothetical protein